MVQDLDAAATVAIPHSNTLHRFSLSRGLCADKWVLDCQKKNTMCTSLTVSTGTYFFCGELDDFHCELSCFDFGSK